jgi:hypothetical protein
MYLLNPSLNNMNNQTYKVQQLGGPNDFLGAQYKITLVRGTDPDRNRVTWETPSSEAIPFHRKPLRHTRLLRDPAQTQV